MNETSFQSRKIEWKLNGESLLTGLNLIPHIVEHSRTVYDKFFSDKFFDINSNSR